MFLVYTFVIAASSRRTSGGSTMRTIRTLLFSFLLALGLAANGLTVPVASANFNVYTTPGEHTIDGRQWRTWCEPYSRTARCRTEIQATTVIRVDSTYQRRTGWTFNNLTYVSSPESLWTRNPLATPGNHVIDGRTWRTECRTPQTGNGCRASILADVVAEQRSPSGWLYRTERKYVLNNIVQFGPLRTDLAELVKWRPGATPLPPVTNYSVNKGPNSTNKVVLSFDDCPKSLSAFKSTVVAARDAGISLALLPRGDCIIEGKFDPDFARANGHYVFNHSVSHRDLTTLSYEDVVRELGAPGVVTTYGRPPFGAWNSTVKRAYDAVGMRLWTWNLDTFDWKGGSQSSVVSTVVTRAMPGNSILMHMQWNGFNGEALRAMQSGLADRGISLCRNRGVTTPVKPGAMDC